MTTRFAQRLALLSLMTAAACHPAARNGGNAGQPQPADSTVVATYSGKSITLGELDKSISKELYETRRRALESKIITELVQAEATKQGLTEDQLFEKISAQAAPKSEEELRKLYEEHKDRFGGASFEEVRPALEKSGGREAEREAVMSFVSKLREEAKVKIALPQPRVTVEAKGPAKGPADAPITIVEFSDFECPYCAMAEKSVDEVMEAYKGKVRVVFRDFPLPFHAKAPKASEAAHCAGEQGKYWEMHAALFADQGKLEIDALKATAGTLSLDQKKFDACLDGGKMAAKLEENKEAGKALGINGTPAFFINGRELSGAVPFEQFKEIIDEELAAAK